MMLYTPMIGVVKVHAAMIGENRKLTFEVPYFCSKNKPIRIAADSASTTAGDSKERISLTRNAIIRNIAVTISWLHLSSHLHLLTEGNGALSPSMADNTGK
jgi:hypothetical protein